MTEGGGTLLWDSYLTSGVVLHIRVIVRSDFKVIL